MARSKKYVISSGAKRSREILALSGAEVSVGSAGGTIWVPTGRKCVDPSTSLGMTGLFCGGTSSVPAGRGCVDPSTSLGMTGLFCGGTIWVPTDRKCVDPSASLGMTGLFCGGSTRLRCLLCTSPLCHLERSREIHALLGGKGGVEWHAVKNMSSRAEQSVVERSWHFRALKCLLVPPVEPVRYLLTVSAWIPRLRWG